MGRRIFTAVPILIPASGEVAQDYQVSPLRGYVVWECRFYKNFALPGRNPFVEIVLTSSFLPVDHSCQEGVLKKHGNGHRPNSSGNRSDIGNLLLNVLEVNVPFNMIASGILLIRYTGNSGSLRQQ